MPPDGRFTLAGYECDLLPGVFDANADSGKIPVPNVSLPVSVEILPCQGVSGDELEVRLSLPLRIGAGASNSLSSSGVTTAKALGNTVRPGPNPSANTNVGGGPTPENIVVSIPLPRKVRNVTDIRCSKGEANYIPSDSELEWRISAREAAGIGSLGATLRFSIIGFSTTTNGQQTTENLKLKTDTFDYDEGTNGIYQENEESRSSDTKSMGSKQDQADIKAKNALLMPQFASLSFCVKGWLASGIRVDALMVNTKASKGLGAGVTPYKGVKYHTISRSGVEIRC